MNKVYTIGRDSSCDIVIPDTTDVVSRVHASLKAQGNGKYILIDQSRNGTYVNGIRMSGNEEIPVTRKDVISFAHVKDLDWEQIPKDKASKMVWILIAIAVVAAACVCYFVFKPENKPVQAAVEKQEAPAETYDMPAVKDTITHDTVSVKPKPVVKPKTKTKTKTEEGQQLPQQEETQIVDALI